MADTAAAAVLIIRAALVRIRRMVIRSYDPSYRGGAETEQPNLFTPNNDGNFFIPGLIDGRQRNKFTLRSAKG